MLRRHPSTTTPVFFAAASLLLWHCCIISPPVTAAWTPSSPSTSSSSIRRRAFTSRNHHPSKSTTSSSRRETTTRLHYFDDISRVDDGWLPETETTPRTPWIPDEKQSAMQDLLGYNAQSAQSLSHEAIELELLQWALDTHLVVSEDHQDEDTPSVPPRYERLSDLQVTSCTTPVECLAHLWDSIDSILSDLEEEEEEEEGAGEVVVQSRLHVFSNATAVWNYDCLETILQAVQLSLPLILKRSNHNAHSTIMIELDGFHPHYKHAPKLWSPEYHAPFPTVGVTVSRIIPKAQAPNKNNIQITKQEIEHLSATRASLEQLFHQPQDNNEASAVLRDEERLFSGAADDLRSMHRAAQDWLLSLQEEQQRPESSSTIPPPRVNVLESSTPVSIYHNIWNALQDLEEESSSRRSSSRGSQHVPSTTTLVIPHFAHGQDFFQLAVTVNAALKRLAPHLEVQNVWHPHFRRRQQQQQHNDGNKAPPPPFAMIQLGLSSSSGDVGQQ